MERLERSVTAAKQVQTDLHAQNGTDMSVERTVQPHITAQAKRNGRTVQLTYDHAPSNATISVQNNYYRDRNTTVSLQGTSGTQIVEIPTGRMYRGAEIKLYLHAPGQPTRELIRMQLSYGRTGKISSHMTRETTLGSPVTSVETQPLPTDVQALFRHADSLHSSLTPHSSALLSLQQQQTSVTEQYGTINTRLAHARQQQSLAETELAQQEDRAVDLRQQQAHTSAAFASAAQLRDAAAQHLDAVKETYLTAFNEQRLSYAQAATRSADTTNHPFATHLNPDPSPNPGPNTPFLDGRLYLDAYNSETGELTIRARSNEPATLILEGQQFAIPASQHSTTTIIIPESQRTSLQTLTLQTEGGQLLDQLLVDLTANTHEQVVWDRIEPSLQLAYQNDNTAVLVLTSPNHATRITGDIAIARTIHHPDGTSFTPITVPLDFQSNQATATVHLTDPHTHQILDTITITRNPDTNQLHSDSPWTASPVFENPLVAASSSLSRLTTAHFANTHQTATVGRQASVLHLTANDLHVENITYSGGRSTSHLAAALSGTLLQRMDIIEQQATETEAFALAYPHYDTLSDGGQRDAQVRFDRDYTRAQSQWHTTSQQAVLAATQELLRLTNGHPAEECLQNIRAQYDAIPNPPYGTKISFGQFLHNLNALLEDPALVTATSGAQQQAAMTHLQARAAANRTTETHAFTAAETSADEAERMARLSAKIADHSGTNGALRHNNHVYQTNPQTGTTVVYEGSTFHSGSRTVVATFTPGDSQSLTQAVATLNNPTTFLAHADTAMPPEDPHSVAQEAVQPFLQETFQNTPYELIIDETHTGDPTIRLHEGTVLVVLSPQELITLHNLQAELETQVAQGTLSYQEASTQMNEAYEGFRSRIQQIHQQVSTAAIDQFFAKNIDTSWRVRQLMRGVQSAAAEADSQPSTALPLTFASAGTLDSDPYRDIRELREASLVPLTTSQYLLELTVTQAEAAESTTHHLIISNAQLTAWGMTHPNLDQIDEPHQAEFTFGGTELTQRLQTLHREGVLDIGRVIAGRISFGNIQLEGANFAFSDTVTSEAIPALQEQIAHHIAADMLRLETATVEAYLEAKISNDFELVDPLNSSEFRLVQNLLRNQIEFAGKETIIKELRRQCYTGESCNIIIETSDPLTNDRIQNLHPEIRDIARDFVNRVEVELGVILRITDGLRTMEQQQNLYSQGRDNTDGPIVTNARAGFSYHNYGLAIDVAEITDENGLNYNLNWDLIGAIGTDVGFTWGGNWDGSLVDRPHFQYSDLTIDEVRTLYLEGQIQDGYIILEQ